MTAKTPPIWELRDEPLTLKMGCGSRLYEIRKAIEGIRDPRDQLVRLVVSRSTPGEMELELGYCRADRAVRLPDILEFQARSYLDESQFNVALVIPTGVDALHGGHCGDAGPVGKLLAGVCDLLITHPNVGNAADINELPANTWYVEGSILSRLLMGTVALRGVRANRLLLLMAPHPEGRYQDATVNMVSAARAAAGFDCPEVVVLPHEFLMESQFSPAGRAIGRLGGLSALTEVVGPRASWAQALAVATRIQVPPEYHHQYFAPSWKQANPWGGVEALLTHYLSLTYNLPSAHAPMMFGREVQELQIGAVMPEKAAEPVSSTYLFSVLKGLHRSPQIVQPGQCGVSAANIHALVIPDGCLGLPTLAALEQGIPVIAVGGQTKLADNPFALWFARAPHLLHQVDNYLEAAGVLLALRQGIACDTLKRPIPPTRVRRY